MIRDARSWESLRTLAPHGRTRYRVRWRWVRLSPGLALYSAAWGVVGGLAAAWGFIGYVLLRLVGA